MAYATLEDLLDQISEQDLTDLTDDTGAGAIDQDKVARAIADADAEIDAYCGVRHLVPLSPVPAVIRKLSVDLALYNLFARRGIVPEDRKDRRDQALIFLRLVGSGKVTLGADDPDSTPSQADDPVVSCQDRVFSRTSLKGW